MSPKDVLLFFGAKYPDEDPNDVFGSNSIYDTGRSTGRKFVRDSGLGSVPKVLLNGVVLNDSGVSFYLIFFSHIGRSTIWFFPWQLLAVREGVISHFFFTDKLKS